MTVLIFALFVAAIVVSVATGTPLMYAMLFGSVLFGSMALLRGYTLKETGEMMFAGVRTSFQAFFVFFLVGILTAAWRASGTIAYFVYWGVELLSPQYFLICAFLILAAESMLIGTSFGSSATLGVMLFVMAKAGGVPEGIAAGAILSGAMVGDRGSPMSSSANLVAAVTGTEIGANVRRMVKSGAIPFAVTAVIFLLLSFRYPLTVTGTDFAAGIAENYRFSLLLLVPAAIVLILPLFHCKIWLTMLVSLTVACGIAVFYQGMPVTALLNTLLNGYHPTFSGEFAERIAGGGLVSMISANILMLAACTYSGIFQKTGVLHGASDGITRLSKRFGPMAGTLVTGAVTAVIACNQTLSVILTEQLTRDAAKSIGVGSADRAMHMENSVIVVSSLIPWNLCCATQLSVLAAPAGCLLYAIYLFAVPVINLAFSLVKWRRARIKPASESAAEA